MGLTKQMSKNTIIAGGQAEKKILILRSSANIFDHTDYKSFKPAMGENVGNKLWLMGLYSCVSGTNCSVDFYDRKMDPGYINENYDMCIKPEANIFGEHFAHWMDYHVKQYKNIRIPIHVIAAGAQAKSYDDLDALAERIKPSAVNFIESIEKTGGTFALRGRFTEALLKKYGYHKAYVTGCPSLFQLGIIQIDHAVSDSRELLTAFNGNLKLCCDYLLKKTQMVVFLIRAYSLTLFVGILGIVIIRHY